MSDRDDVLDGALAPVENTALFGHGDATAFLARAYRSGRIHHAVLIEGPEGIGKATLAFRFANHVLSHPEPARAPETLAVPDPRSPIYRQSVSGASHHLLHLTRPKDEKSGRTRTAITVDEVRRAGRFLTQTSGTGNWRIVIIDPADDLNRAAANAVLKILEEPPRNALFLVISHAPGRLLPTIRSRCLPLRLKPLGDTDLRQVLHHLGIDETGADIDAVVRRASGSVSRALAMLRYGGLDIAATFDTIMRSDPATARKEMYAIADVLSARDRDTAFAFFQTLTDDWLTERARMAARAGHLTKAARAADLVARVDEAWAETAAYNLDRKQTILTVFSILGEVSK